jgi:hypothetical protein
MVSKIAATDRGAKCGDAEWTLANSAPAPNPNLNENIILIIYLAGPKIPVAAANSHVPDGGQLAASAASQQPSWLVNHD